MRVDRRHSFEPSRTWPTSTSTTSSPSSDTVLEPKTRTARADAFDYKAAVWLSGLPAPTAATLRAVAQQFARGGTDELEQQGILQTPAVAAAGGLKALGLLGSAADILRATKERLFAA